jgi:hypothetical protein
LRYEISSAILPPIKIFFYCAMKLAAQYSLPSRIFFIAL